MDPLDPDRIATIKYIYDLTKRTITVGDTVRLGIEGDPCCRYRSADDIAARTGTVTEIVRDQNGEPVKIVAQMDGNEQGSAQPPHGSQRELYADIDWAHACARGRAPVQH